MTLDEIADFFNTEYRISKRDLKTIKNTIFIGQRFGYIISKNGPGDLSIREMNAITDFTKPLKIINNIPTTRETEVCNRVPLPVLVECTQSVHNFDEHIWSYLANRKDGDRIDFSQLGSNELEIALKFDVLVWSGFLVERETRIEFYLYPRADARTLPCAPLFATRRMTPIKR